MITDTRTSRRSTTTRMRATAVGGAAVATSLIWLVAVPVLGVDLQAPAGPGSTDLEPVTLPAVIAMSLGTALVAWGLLAILERFTTRARGVWTGIATVVLVISYGGPLLGAGVATGSRVTLALMHTAVAVVLIPLLRHRPAGRAS